MKRAGGQFQQLAFVFETDEVRVSRRCLMDITNMNLNISFQEPKMIPAFIKCKKAQFAMLFFGPTLSGARFSFWVSDHSLVWTEANLALWFYSGFPLCRYGNPRIISFRCIWNCNAQCYAQEESGRVSGCLRPILERKASHPQ